MAVGKEDPLEEPFLSMTMTDLNGRHRWPTLMRRGGTLAVAALAVAALVGCEQPGMERPADPPAEMSLRAASTAESRSDVGDACDDSSMLTLCNTDNGSSWPETHDGSKFTVTLKFNKDVLVHPLVMRDAVFSVRNGRITSARPVGGISVQISYGHMRRYSSVQADQWVLTVEPRQGHNVQLFYPVRECTNWRALCTDKKRLSDDRINPKPLAHRIRIKVPREEPTPPPPVDPAANLPGAVRNVRAYKYHVGWQAPASHGGALITEYRIFAGGCDGFTAKVLLHPDDFWQHGGHDGYYHTAKGWRGEAGVQAVNSYGAGPCTASS